MLALRADVRTTFASGLGKGLSARQPDRVSSTASLAILALILRLAFPFSMLSMAAGIRAGLPLARGIEREWNA